MERAGAHMHVASTIIFDGEPPTHDEFRDQIESRLHLVPRFRQKLRTIPFDQGRPVWVDDPFLNLDYHVRRTALPAPGSEEQLRNLAARIFSQQLDRTKPLWEVSVAAPSTPFNVEIGPHRRLAFVRGDLRDFKRVKNAHGGTVNDVVLSVVAGALGNYLRARGHDTDELKMRAMVPVSIRADEERGALGNRISAMMAPLPA